MNDDFGTSGYFMGNWTFTRIVKTGTSGQLYASANGDAFFEDSAGGGSSLIYSEEGTMELNSGTSHRFKRSYRYLFEDNMSVYFNDGPNQGNLYQSYTLSEDGSRFEMTGVHLCGADQYRGAYYRRAEDSFYLRTIVTGATKDMIIETNYFRK